MNENVKAAGLAGELEMPVIGHLASMKCTINWTLITDDGISLAAPVTQMITVRGSQQYYDPGSGTTQTQAITVVMKVQPRNIQLGKLSKGQPTDTSNEFEVFMIKVLLDGEECLLADKVNYIFRVDGYDYLESVRSDLGMI